MHPLFALGLVNKHINTPGLVAHCKDSSGAETNWVNKHSMKFSTITVILILNTAILPFHKTHWLLRSYHQTKFLAARF